MLSPKTKRRKKEKEVTKKEKGNKYGTQRGKEDIRTYFMTPERTQHNQTTFIDAPAQLRIPCRVLS